MPRPLLARAFYPSGFTPNGPTLFFYEYTVKDHLGNARVNFQANGALITNIEDHHYYPFGMKMEGIGSAAVANKYTYNDKAPRQWPQAPRLPSINNMGTLRFNTPAALAYVFKFSSKAVKISTQSASGKRPFQEASQPSFTK